MEKLSISNILPLEQYAKMRAEFRQRVMAHKKARRVALGDSAALYFEDLLTMQYQAQEILRVERISEEDAVNEEIETYNDLIPDGDNWKATFMLEYPDADIRRQALQKLIGVENCLYMRTASLARLFAIADEDLPRSTEEKTSSVHFMRFPLAKDHALAIRAGAPVWLGVDHAHLQIEVALAPETQASLAADLSDEK